MIRAITVRLDEADHAALERQAEQLRILWGAFIRSGMVLGGDRVLVDEAAEPVVSADRGRSRGFEWSC